MFDVFNLRFIFFRLEMVKCLFLKFRIDLLLVNSKCMDDIKLVLIVMHFLYSFHDHELLLIIIRVMFNLGSDYRML